MLLLTDKANVTRITLIMRTPNAVLCGEFVAERKIRPAAALC